jgi:hypothetical protein
MTVVATSSSTARPRGSSLGGQFVESGATLRGDRVEVLLGLHTGATPRTPPVGVARRDPQHLRAVRRHGHRRTRALHRQRDHL